MKPRVFQFGRLLTCVALFGVFDLHWFGMQSVAWLRMIRADIEQQRQQGIEESNRKVAVGELLQIVARNISGSTQCELCRAISAQQSKPQQEKREAFAQVRVELIPAETSLIGIFPGPVELLGIPVSAESAAVWSSSPQVPPPRLA